MSKSVCFYESEFQKVLLGTQFTLNVMAGTQSVGPEFVDCLAREMLKQCDFSSALMPEITAATHLLEIYADKLIAHHKEEALFLKESLETLADTKRKNVSLKEQKNLFTVLLQDYLKQAIFPKKKSDFSSLCFVLVTQLNLPVNNSVMVKIIAGANFSKGFLYRDSDKMRRALELSKLPEASNDNKPSVTLNLG